MWGEMRLSKFQWGKKQNSYFAFNSYAIECWCLSQYAEDNAECVKNKQNTHKQKVWEGLEDKKNVGLLGM